MNLLGFLCITFGVGVIAYPGREYKRSPELDYLNKRQSDVLRLVKFINSPCYDKEFVEIFQKFSFEEYAKFYKPEILEIFTKAYKTGFLPKGEIFSIFNKRHMKQAQILFKLFYFTKDYETFFKTAVWARQKLNQGLFLYSFSVALIHREDTNELTLPPIYEIYPHYFFGSDVMQKAYNYKMSFNKMGPKSESIYTFHSNYSGSYLNLNPEQSLSYFLEDVGINAFYYYYSIYYPYWMDGIEFKLKKDRRSDLFYMIHQQILARYYMERLSYNYGGFEYFNWELPFKNGFYPSLIYPNGLPFPERPNFANLYEYLQNYGQRWCLKSEYGYGFTHATNYERRILDVIDSGFAYDYDGKKLDVFTMEGEHIFEDLLEGNADSPNLRFYGDYLLMARHLLGYSKQPLDDYRLAPSALEHFETSLRDPAFYQLFKRIILLFQQFKHHHPYSFKDIHFNGFKIEDVDFDPLITFYDSFFSDITNGLPASLEEYETKYLRIKVHQYRLNHKKFNYKIYIDSQKEAKVSIKVFIGPKFDEHGRTIPFQENRLNFILLDHFVSGLKSGKNVLERSSYESPYFREDYKCFFDLYKSMKPSKNSEDMMGYYKDLQLLAYPHRYMLPKGRQSGMPYQIYVIVYPFVPHEKDPQSMYSRIGSGKMVLDNYPFGYPFDRPIEFEEDYFVPNSYLKTIKIFHEGPEYINQVHKYDPDFLKYQQGVLNFDSENVYSDKYPFKPQKDEEFYNTHERPFGNYRPQNNHDFHNRYDVSNDEYYHHDQDFNFGEYGKVKHNGESIELIHKDEHKIKKRSYRNFFSRPLLRPVEDGISVLDKFNPFSNSNSKRPNNFNPFKKPEVINNPVQISKPIEIIKPVEIVEKNENILLKPIEEGIKLIDSLNPFKKTEIITKPVKVVEIKQNPDDVVASVDNYKHNPFLMKLWNEKANSNIKIENRFNDEDQNTKINTENINTATIIINKENDKNKDTNSKSEINTSSNRQETKTEKVLIDNNKKIEIKIESNDNYHDSSGNSKSDTVKEAISSSNEKDIKENIKNTEIEVTKVTNNVIIKDSKDSSNKELVEEQSKNKNQFINIDYKITGAENKDKESVKEKEKLDKISNKFTIDDGIKKTEDKINENLHVKVEENKKDSKNKNDKKSNKKHKDDDSSEEDDSHEKHHKHKKDKHHKKH